ncbi:SCO family protein [Trujillonella humicola]|uniref:SCO family protein n=1 Tax=Trujillonella humicola TaxID=3383699 RepID=UPI0039061E05
MLRRRGARGVLTALAVVAVAASAAACSAEDDSGHDGSHAAGVSISTAAEDGPYAGRELAEPLPRPSFTLTDQTGAPFDFAALTAGQPTLLFFGYANCPDICPTTMADVALALRAVPDDVASRTRVVFVTTDPARDTPDFLRDYLGQFDGNLPNDFVGLTGTLEQVEAAQTAAGVTLAEGDGTMHATTLLMFGPDDVARVVFAAGDTSDEIAQDLEVVAGG